MCIENWLQRNLFYWQLRIIQQSTYLNFDLTSKIGSSCWYLGTRDMVYLEDWCDFDLYNYVVEGCINLLDSLNDCLKGALAIQLWFCWLEGVRSSMNLYCHSYDSHCLQMMCCQLDGVRTQGLICGKVYQKKYDSFHWGNLSCSFWCPVSNQSFVVLMASKQTLWWVK